MSKYDFGYELKNGTTNKWAYDQVDENTKVLEIGPSIGCLTFNLSKVKNCIVDIVEIDEEAGRRASEFAEIALLGKELGNLNNDNWFDRLKNNKYDYIVALDVLEHLENPVHVMSLLKSVLTEKGKIILSIPNISHNAIIMELLYDKFTYSDLGLLDSTHIHFFAYESILQMVSDNGLYVSVLDAITKNILETEFANKYSNVPADVEGFLRTRTKGDVYQYLLVLDQKEGKTVDLLGKGITESSHYLAKVLVDGLMKNQQVYPHLLNGSSFNIDMSSYSEAKSIRIIPIEQDAIITNLEVRCTDCAGNDKLLHSNWTSGLQISDNVFVLHNGNYEINFQLPEYIKNIRVFFNCILLNNQMTAALSEVCGVLQGQKSTLEEQETAIEKQRNEIEEQRVAIEEQRNEIEEQKAEIEQQRNELICIKDTRIYKIMNPFVKLERKVIELLWRK